MKKIVCVVVGTVLAACGGHGADAEHGGETHGGGTGVPSSVPVPAISGEVVYVVNGEDSSISVIDPSASKVVATIKLENVTYPHHVYLSPDRAKLAVAVPGHDLSGGHSQSGGEHGAHGGTTTAPTGGAVLVLDASTGATIKSRRLERSNHNAVFSPDGSEIWTAQLVDEGTVLVLDAATLDTKSTIRVGRVPAEVTFTSDGRYAFVANGTSDDVTVIDARTKSVAKTIPMDRQPVGAWPGADGLMYVDCEVAKTVKAVDPKTLDIVRTYSLGFTPGIATVPPSRTDELWLTNTDAGKIVFNKTSADAKVAELDTEPGAHALAFTPDGKTAFVTNQLAGSVSVVDATTRAVRATIAVGRKPNGVVYRSK